jgi:hypothetical protein
MKQLLFVFFTLCLAAVAQPIVTAPVIPPDANFLPNDGAIGTTQSSWVTMNSSGNAIARPE